MDTGIGISPEQQARLFQSFEQGDASIRRRFGGTGLGLAICKRLVEGMKGQIEAESTPGLGSRFRFSLPLPPADGPVARDAADAVLAPARPLNLLLVEDLPINAAAARGILERAGHRTALVTLALASHMTQPLSRDFLLDVISNRDPREISEHTVDNLIVRLRRKMQLDGVAAPIATVRSIGYALVPLQTAARS